MTYHTMWIAIVALIAAVGCGAGDKPDKETDAGTEQDAASPDAAAMDDMGADDAGGTMDVRADEDAGAIDDVGTGGDAGGAGDMGGTDTGPASCDREGFVVRQQEAVFDVPNDQFLYTGFSSRPQGPDPYSFVSFEIYPYAGGMVEPHTFDFTAINYVDCGTCMLIFADCMRPDGCQKIFLAEEGDAVISAASTTDGEPFQASFNDVVLREVTIDTSTFESTVVPDGETWCIDNFPANTVIEVSQ